jgi:hypothetical protein
VLATFPPVTVHFLRYPAHHNFECVVVSWSLVSQLGKVTTLDNTPKTDILIVLIGLLPPTKWYRQQKGNSGLRQGLSLKGDSTKKSSSGKGNLIVGQRPTLGNALRSIQIILAKETSFLKIVMILTLINFPPLSTF